MFNKSKGVYFLGLFVYCFMGVSFTQCKQEPIAAPIIDSTQLGCDYVFDESSLLLKGWKKSFEDQFNADLNKWNIWNAGAYNNELQLYQSQNLLLLNGILEIHAKKEKVSGATLPNNPALKDFSYSSGRIESKSSFSANTNNKKVKFIARLKLPVGYGMWPAFWAYGDPWPTQGEIDFVEARGSNVFEYLTNYYYGDIPGVIYQEDNTATIKTVSNLSSCFHVYEMEWSETELNSYLDGKLVESKKSGKHIPNLFGKSEHIVLNLAVGGGFFPSYNPALIETGILYVDWVKVYQFQ